MTRHRRRCNTEGADIVVYAHCDAARKKADSGPQLFVTCVVGELSDHYRNQLILYSNLLYLGVYKYRVLYTSIQKTKLVRNGIYTCNVSTEYRRRMEGA